jgi:hypothetical protein
MKIERPPNGKIVFNCWKLDADHQVKVFELRDSLGLGHPVIYEADSEKEWDALEVPSCCEFRAEYCLEEWNKHEKKA